VTPFDKWFESTIVPTMPPDMPAAARKLVREPFKACWNAALKQVCSTQFTREEFPIPCGLPAEIREQILGLQVGQ
jgi:hypothetical protein